jgi:uncharacterized membrane protein YbhN (UPF0104 family)
VAGPLLLLFVFFEFRPGPFLAAADRLLPPSVRPKVRHAAMNFRDGLGTFRRPAPIFWALVYSVLMWACLVAVVLLTLEALQLPLPAEAGVVVLVVMAIGTMIPAAPGYIGTLQYAGMLALLQYGVERSSALSFTLLYHAGQWLPVTAVGLFYFMRQNLSLRLAEMPDPGGGADLPMGDAGPRSGPGEGGR